MELSNQKRRKVLITIDWFLPGTLSGGPVRSYANLIDHLKDDFEFYIITRNTDYGSDVPYQGIKPNNWIEFNNYTKVFYMSSDQLSFRYLKQVIELTEYDIAYINGIFSWYFSILPVIIMRKSRKPVIIASRGMLNPQAFSVKRTKKKMFLKLAKVFGLYNKVSFHATNTDEAHYIKSILGKETNVKIAPNLPRRFAPNFLTTKVKHKPVRFINVARISREKGTLKMLNAIAQINSPLVLDIYGPVYDTVYWEQCRSVIKRLPSFIEVNYKGTLASENVPSTLASYDFFVLLSEGENFGHAILEALSVGLPVLISNLTPWKNLEKQFLGWDIDTGNQDKIIEAIEQALAMSNEDYVKYSVAAHNHARIFMENPELIEQNKALFCNEINN